MTAALCGCVTRAPRTGEPVSDDNDMSTHVVNRRSGQHGRKNLVSFTDLVAQGVPRFTESLDCGACRDRRSFGNRRLVELGLGLVVGFRLGKPDQLFRFDRSRSRWFNHRSFNYWSFGNRSFNHQCFNDWSFSNRWFHDLDGGRLDHGNCRYRRFYDRSFDNRRRRRSRGGWFRPRLRLGLTLGGPLELGSNLRFERRHGRCRRCCRARGSRDSGSRNTLFQALQPLQYS